MTGFNGYNNENNKSYYYNENYRKPRNNKKKIIAAMVIVSLVSSIIGGIIVFAAFQFAAPVLQPSINSYMDSRIPAKEQSLQTSDASTNHTKQIIIEKTDSVVSAIAEKASPSIVGIKVTATV